ncbi:MAG: hypothetical protein ACK50Q_14460 [Labrys sp. (in: a-proteobacteria)]
MKYIHRTLAAALLSGVVMATSPSMTPAFAETLTVTDVLVGESVYAITIPKIEVVDGNISEADIRSLFKGEDPTGLSAKLATWNAASITIPEFSFKQTFNDADGAPQTVEVIYKGLTIDSLENGVAKSSRIEGGELKTSGPNAANGTFGAFTTGLFDFGALMAFYVGGGEKTGDMRTVYKDIAFDGMTLTGPEGFKCEIGKFAAAEFKARPMEISFLELATLAESMNGEREPTADELAKFVGFYKDIFTGIESSPSTFSGFDCRFPDERGRPVTFVVGEVTVDAFGNARYPAITMNNMNVTIEGDGFVKLGKVTFKGMELGGIFEAIEAAGDQLSPAWFETNYRKVIPAVLGFGIEGVDIDVPDSADPTQRVKGKIGKFDVTLGNHVLGIPTDISIVSEHTVVDIPENTTDENFKQLRALGYSTIDVGATVKLKWDEAAGTISVDEASMTGENMGTVNISGLIGNAGKDLFAEDPGTMQGAAMGLSVKALTLAAEDTGIAGKIFELVAKEQGGTADAIRGQVSGMAAGMIPMVLGGTEQAQQVANAVMTFLNGGTSLTISAEAKDPAGIGLADFMAAQENPAVLAEKVNLSAEAK